MRQPRFISKNPDKIREVEKILTPIGIQVIPVKKTIHELQTENAEALVRDKVLKAFQEVGHPLFVEHTGLYLDGLNDLPGGLTQIFWDKLECEDFAAFVNRLTTNRVVARTKIGYCDSKRIHYFDGEVAGRISATPRGPKGFQWDPVFIPDGYDETFAQLGDKKNDISMRRHALDAFAVFLKEQL